MNNFSVEGRYFEDSLTAFTFAGIQADRMDRAVEVRIPAFHDDGLLRPGAWHGTARPESYRRLHAVMPE